jgi:NADH dehydrogenase
VHVKVLLIGGNDILQRAIAAALIERSHDVRTALDDKNRLPGSSARAEPPVTYERGPAVRDPAAGCDAIVFVDPSVAPGSPATDGGVLAAPPPSHTPPSGRMIHVVARHAARPDREGSTGHLTLRTSPVYGVGDDLVTVLLIMMRSLPVVPILSDTHAVRLLWHEDLARAIAAAVSLEAEQSGQTMDIAGPDAITQNQLYDRIASLIDRRPLRVPVPDFIAAYGARLAQGLRIDAPFEASHLEFVKAGPGADSDENVLSTVFGVTPTALDDGLRRLVAALPELTPADGVGRVEVKRFSTVIAGGRYDAAELLRAFRARFRDLMPVATGVEPSARDVTLDEGAVITMALPGRGHVQVRVEEATEGRIVLSTLRGHALAGFVQFRTRPVGDAVEFEVMTCDAAANAMDWLALTLGGARIQDANWTRLAENVGAMAGGSTAPVQADARKLDAREATAVDRWIRTVVDRQKAAPEPVSGSLPKV